MKIAIRADGGAEIGMGHVMRTLVLAKHLAKNNEVFFLCRIDGNSSQFFMKNSQVCQLNTDIEQGISDKYEKGIEKILNEGFKVKLVREDYLIEDLQKVEADILITDSYDVNEEYFNRTKEMFSKTAYIDDMNLYCFNVDFLINQNIDGEDFNYKTNKETKIMVGCKYVLLRDEFAQHDGKNINEKVKDIMVTVGGGDTNHITEKILTSMKDLDYNFHVVIGPSFNTNNSIRGFESEKIKIYYNANMYELMQKCDIAISACGSTLYELAVCGVPSIGIIIAGNQEGIANKMNDLGIIKNTGWFNKIKKEDFIKVVKSFSKDYNLRKAMSKKASKIIDGKGAERISNILNSVK